MLQTPQRVISHAPAERFYVHIVGLYVIEVRMCVVGESALYSIWQRGITHHTIFTWSIYKRYTG